jgi:hypothetical protein
MKQTQGRRLIALLKKRGYTTMEMLLTGVSTAPWKRIKESLRPDENLVISKRSWGTREINVYRVVKHTKVV